MLRLLLLILLISLNSCYCFHKSGVTQLRSLASPQPFSLCESWSGDGKTILLNSYVGFLPTNKESILRNYASFNDIRFENGGLYGLRAEKLFGSSFLLYTAGLDYSFATQKIFFSHTNESYMLKFNQHRLLGSLNIFTLIQKNTIGYLTFQAGNSFQKRSDLILTPSVQFIDPPKRNNFEYRIGYGFQFYLRSPLAITIEGGYQGGSYIKTGLSYWIF